MRLSSEKLKKICKNKKITLKQLLKEAFQEAEMQRILERVESIVKHYNKVDPDNVRHTLILLQEKPIERLRRALVRARKFNIH